MYTTNEELRQLVTEWRDTGTMPDALVGILLHIVRGVMRRSLFLQTTYTRQLYSSDIIAEFWEVVLKKRDNVDVTKNVFSYYTTVAVHIIQEKKKQFEKDKPIFTNLEAATRRIREVF